MRRDLSSLRYSSLMKSFVNSRVLCALYKFPLGDYFLWLKSPEKVCEISLPINEVYEVCYSVIGYAAHSTDLLIFF